MMRGKLSRRAWLRQASRIAAALPLLPAASRAAFLLQKPQQSPQHVSPSDKRQPSPLFAGDPAKYQFTPDENAFLEEAGGQIDSQEFGPCAR